MNDSKHGDDRLGPADYPALFVDADASAVVHQRRYLRLLWVLVSVTVVAPGVQFFSDLNGLNSVARSALFVAMLIQFVTASLAAGSSLVRRWYQCRALAESIKSMTWKFAVGGAPFVIAMPHPVALNQLSTAITDLVRTAGVGGPFLDPALASGHEDLSRVQGFRALPLHERQRIYRALRLEDQLHWYVGKAQSLGRTLKIMNGAMVMASGTAVCAALVGIIVATNDLAPELAALSASITLGLLTVTQARHLSTDAAAYHLTSYEIRQILSEEDPADEASWAQWVDDAEEALSREHVMWRASRVSAA